jgi:amylosucrase
MALLWETLATRDARLLRQSMRHWFAMPPGTAWVNYVRSHDDIGWTFDDGDAAVLGMNGYDHRRFLNAFYTGRFPGSFARGLPFQENPKTGDARISGTAASLAGLEKAMAEEGSDEIELAIKRVLMLYSVALSAGGVPLLYLGDEFATLNDYGYREDPAKAGDSRWVHRPALDPERLARRTDASTPEGRLFAGIVRLIGIRRAHVVFSGSDTEFLDAGNDHIFAYAHRHGANELVALVNVTEAPQSIAAGAIGHAHAAVDLISGSHVTLDGSIALDPYQIMWLLLE